MTVLTDEWAQKLLKEPESGMGYHHVFIKFKNGKGIECYVLSGSIIDTHDFDPSFIDEIIVLS